MDLADACSLGRLPSLNRYFLLIVHKVTKHWATYTSKTRGCGTPVELLKQHVVTTGRKPRDLRVDNAKEFTSQEIVNFYQENNIILQPVVAYNHTMQARVEGAIGCSKDLRWAEFELATFTVLWERIGPLCQILKGPQFEPFSPRA